MAKKKASKKSSKKKASKKISTVEKTKKKVKKRVRRSSTKPDLRDDKDIAMDFAVKVYKKFDKIVKAIILFGSAAKDTATSSSDIDIIIIIDDASVLWDQELIAWYREELAKLSASSNYIKDLHITTVKLTTWWSDLMKGDPTLVNVLRYGEALIDVGGFFNPIKVLLQQGRITSTPESIYLSLERSSEHFRRSKMAELGAIEGLFWAMVDSSQAALMAANMVPPSIEHIPAGLKKVFVDKKLLKVKYLEWFRGLYVLHKGIIHGDISDLKGVEIDEWQDRTEEFIGVMAKLVKDLVDRKK